jgi:hypothetical protein
MAHSISVQFEPGYLHLVVTGDNTQEDVAGYLDKVPRLCVGHAYSYVLIEEHLNGPSLAMLSIFDIASKGAESAQSSSLLAIAYVDTNPQHDHSKMQFAGNVAQKRGLQVQPFATVAAAKRWLSELTASGAEA